MRYIAVVMTINVVQIIPAKYKRSLFWLTAMSSPITFHQTLSISCVNAINVNHVNSLFILMPQNNA